MVFDRWDHFEVGARPRRSSLLHMCVWSQRSSPLKEGPSLSLLIYSLIFQADPSCSKYIFHPLHSPHLTLPYFFFLVFFQHSDVPVPLLQVHQHGLESSKNARDDAALCSAHAALPIMPGHAQQQDPPAVPPHTPPQCCTWLRWQANCHSKFCLCFVSDWTQKERKIFARWNIWQQL